MPVYAILDTDYTFFSQLGQNFEQQTKSPLLLIQFYFRDRF